MLNGPVSRSARYFNMQVYYPGARFVNFYSYDGWVDSIDLLDAFHPQTMLAYGMNGRDLAIAHGAPLRLRVETQKGY